LEDLQHQVERGLFRKDFEKTEHGSLCTVEEEEPYATTLNNNVV